VNAWATKVALRWISHHSLLSREKGDAILIGASSVEHLESNLVDLEKGHLPQDGEFELLLFTLGSREADHVCTRSTKTVVDILDESWDLVKSVATKVRHSLIAGYETAYFDSI